jgi:hypothetical protein
LESIYDKTIRCQFANPLQIARCMLRIQDCSFPTAGQYDVCLLALGEVLAQQKVTIKQESG